MDRSHAVMLVEDAIRENINVEPGSYLTTTTYKEIGADSLEVVKLVMSIEEHLDGKEFNAEDINKCQTPEDLITLLVGKY